MADKFDQEQAGSFADPDIDPNNFEFDIGNQGKIEPGDYEMRIDDVVKDTSNSGNKMWNWHLTFTQGQFAGRTLINYTALTDAAAWKVAEMYEACGIEADDNGIGRFRKSDVVGVLVMARITNEIYEGRERPSIDTVAPHPKGAGFRGGI